uniref:Putative 2-oxoglutarate oxidoreductase n=1 Tax=uncultured bacterium fosmid pJB17E7_contig I TaxID=1478055 RepID=A0A0H3U7G8_9BACT|nr:putative 2-oxoglutarate oxidoreductase [uncultured bacterium fosmid pJB17E7_contig I]
MDKCCRSVHGSLIDVHRINLFVDNGERSGDHEAVDIDAFGDFAVDLDVAEGVVGEHILFHPLVGLNGGHLPAAVAAADDFDEAEAFFVALVLESLADGGFGLADVGGSVDALAGDEAGAGQGGQHFGDTQGVAVDVHAAAVGSGGGLHADECGGGHLAAGHAVDAVVNEDHDDVLAAVGCVDGLGGADGGEVAVALIGEDVAVGVEALDGGCHCGGTAVGGFLEVNIKIVVGHDGASDRGDADGLVLDAHLVDDFGDDAVGGAVSAAGAVVHYVVGKHFCLCVNQILRFYYIVCHFIRYF